MDKCKRNCIVQVACALVLGAVAAIIPAKASVGNTLGGWAAVVFVVLVLVASGLAVEGISGLVGETMDDEEGEDVANL